MSITTRTGDDGTTGLYGGKRVSKASKRMEAIGTVDELNAILGVVLTQPLEQHLTDVLRRVQHLLFAVGADLAAPEGTERITTAHVKLLEAQIALLEQELPTLTHFILPGGSSAGALLHQARTVCRRAERAVVALEPIEPVAESLRLFLNRLSDYLFLAARSANAAQGVEEERATA
ncbi:ATP:cob(I)alamin adenosyltransferase [Candidatus Peregrinibacteria bacterium CG10_big_fil_rev_8_21_14_0_10_55_24]|nr:MAG: ATP:cob(I)alamin adenosyltransferase [Candidatus Peregrinibacteria bacterium CG10_big_fil_rev_8_21_14_0_10_55_24]